MDKAISEIALEFIQVGSQLTSMSKSLTIRRYQKIAKLNFQFIVLLFMLFFHPQFTYSAVWQEQNQWNEAYEVQFSQWIQQVPTNIFTVGQWGEIPTDCADAVYYLRAIFAFENQLPFVMHKVNSDAKLTNQLNNFDHIKDPIKRVRKFLTEAVYVYGNVETIARDSYPIAINRHSLVPSTLWLRFPAHVEYVRQISDSGVIELMGSTKPLEIRELILKSDLFAKPIDPQKHGFRKWKWPQLFEEFERNLPNYSYEQFEFGGRSQEDDYLDNFNRLSILWKRQIEKRLALTHEDPAILSQRIMGNICQQIRLREKIVHETQIKKQEKNACFNLSEYDDLSTPTRDEIIFTGVQELLKTRKVIGFTNKQKVNAIKDIFAYCEDIRVTENLILPIEQFILNVMNRDVSSNPNDTIESRWGINSSQMQNSCPTEVEMKEKLKTESID